MCTVKYKSFVLIKPLTISDLTTKVHKYTFFPDFPLRGDTTRKDKGRTPGRNRSESSLKWRFFTTFVSVPVPSAVTYYLRHVMTKRKDINDQILVYIKVHPVLRDFIICSMGSDLIVPDDKSPLWVAVKTHLREIPNDYKPHAIGPVAGSIRIALPPVKNGEALYNAAAGATIMYNYLYRNYLDKKGQVVVADLLMKSFKDKYRSFMAGYLASHPNMRDISQIKDGINEFCRIFRINMDDKITYEMLRKDWYRFRTRESASDVCDEVKENI